MFVSVSPMGRMIDMKILNFFFQATGSSEAGMIVFAVSPLPKKKKKFI